jgi:pimeloyl-ACP methyl ester carboxylesterase
VLLVHGSFGWGAETWAAQAPLAETFRLEVVDRRGFGDSPTTARVDFAVDADDLAALLGDGAHLVGHSYGGIGCLLAAAARPTAVRSLTVVEPPLFRIAPGHPAVATVAAALRTLWAEADARSPEAFRAGFLRALGLSATPGLRLKPAAAAAARASMTERLAEEADVPLAALARLGAPRLVVSGRWDVVPAAARSRGGAAFAAVCDALADAIGAERVALPGAGHNPQRLGEPFNELLARFLRNGSTGRVEGRHGSG